MDSLKHLSDRLKANDIAWFKNRFNAGEFSWLKEHLPEGGYTKLGERIEAGDLAYVRTLFRGLALPGFGTLFGATAVGAATTAGSGATAGGTKTATAVASADHSDRKKKGAVWLLPVALLAAILLGFGLSRLGDDKNKDTVVAETTAVVDESVAPASDLAVADTAADTAAAGTTVVATGAAADTAADTAAAAPA